MPAQSEELSFEAALEQLDAVIRTLEEGKVPLNDAVDAYARGMELARHCSELLEKQEGRITAIVEGGGEVPVAGETQPRPRSRAKPDPGLFPGVGVVAPRDTADINPDDIPF